MIRVRTLLLTTHLLKKLQTCPKSSPVTDSRSATMAGGHRVLMARRKNKMDILFSYNAMYEIAPEAHVLRDWSSKK